MPYGYVEQRPFVFTENGQVMFLKIRDNAAHLIKMAGAVRCQELLRNVTGDSWNMLACIDRLVELNELREISQAGYVAGQHRIFVALDT